jgi:hypothetical protein
MNTAQIIESILREHEVPMSDALARALERVEDMEIIVAAAKNLVAVKGRYHGEMAYLRLAEAIKNPRGV